MKLPDNDDDIEDQNKNNLTNYYCVSEEKEILSRFCRILVDKFDNTCKACNDGHPLQ